MAKKGKERLVSDEHIKAVADRAEARADGKPLPDVEEPASPLNPPTDPRGRPTTYKPEYCDIVRKLCERGYVDEEVADVLGVTVRTLFRWRAKYPEFGHAVVGGKETPDDRVERSLYMRAIGYSYEAEKVTKSGDIVTYKVHVPPDPVSAKFWLTNRRQGQWHERKEVEIGRPGDFAAMEHDKLVESIQADLAEMGIGLLELAGPAKTVASESPNTAAALPPKNRVKGNGTQH